jgi:hypothetical protein
LLVNHEIMLFCLLVHVAAILKYFQKIKYCKCYSSKHNYSIRRGNAVNKRLCVSGSVELAVAGALPNFA